MNSQSPILTMMVALNCEAKPWIDFYALKKLVDKPFALYVKEGVNIEIVITGIGALAMSTAVGWVAGRDDSASRVWFNIGIAGHLDREVGEAVRVHSYIDASDLRRDYSQLTAKWSGDSDALMSVNAPSDSYPDAAMVDMEGVAFYRAAGMFSSTELIESIKVVSDNQQNSIEGLNASKISQLMHPHAATVNQFTENLMALVVPSTLCRIELTLRSLRVTHSQQQQLDRLLAKASVLELHDSVAALDLSSETKIEAVLSQLRTLIEAAAPSISVSTSTKKSGRLAGNGA